MTGSHQGSSGDGVSVLPVALVLPVKNEAAALPELFSALALAPVWPAEIAFSDAGSTDGTPDLIHAWWRDHGRPGVSMHVLERPGALPGGGRNAGIGATRSEWIAFLDGGIRPEPDWLGALYASAQAGGRDHAFGLCRFDARGAIALAACALTNGVGASATVLPAAMFHRRVFERIGLLEDHLRAAEDLVWLRRFALAYGSRHVCPAAVVHYTHYPDTLAGLFRKWFAFEKSSVAAGVRTRMRALYLVGGLTWLMLVAISPPAALGALLAYGVLRGVADPMRRSRNWRWWLGTPSAATLAPLCALVMDVGKVCGALAGLVQSRNPPQGPAHPSP